MMPATSSYIRPRGPTSSFSGVSTASSDSSTTRLLSIAQETTSVFLQSAPNHPAIISADDYAAIGAVLNRDIGALERVPNDLLPICRKAFRHNGRIMVGSACLVPEQELAQALVVLPFRRRLEDMVVDAKHRFSGIPESLLRAWHQDVARRGYGQEIEKQNVDSANFSKSPQKRHHRRSPSMTHVEDHELLPKSNPLVGTHFDIAVKVVTTVEVKSDYSSIHEETDAGPTPSSLILLSSPIAAGSPLHHQIPTSNSPLIPFSEFLIDDSSSSSALSVVSSNVPPSSSSSAPLLGTTLQTDTLQEEQEPPQDLSAGVDQPIEWTAQNDDELERHDDTPSSLDDHPDPVVPQSANGDAVPSSIIDLDTLTSFGEMTTAAEETALVAIASGSTPAADGHRQDTTRSGRGRKRPREEGASETVQEAPRPKRGRWESATDTISRLWNGIRGIRFRLWRRRQV